MGAWTSAFTIGISNLLYPPFLQLRDILVSNQPLLRGQDSNLRHLAYETKLEPSPVHPALISLLTQGF